MKNLDFDWQINEFMVYCRSTQLREKSMASYKDRLDQMQEYVEQQLAGDPMRESSKDQILQHVAALNRIFFVSPDEYLEKPNSLLKLISCLEEV